MLDVQLIEAGFYQIAWPAAGKLTGTTYIRPGRRESVRVHLTTDACEAEVYAGDLMNGRLVYRGPAQAAALQPWLTIHAN